MSLLSADLVAALREMTRQNQTTQETMVQILEKMSPDQPQVGAPRKTDTEFLIESLSNSMTEFHFDLESNSTFENWYSSLTQTHTASTSTESYQKHQQNSHTMKQLRN